MAHTRELRNEPTHGVLRTGRAAGGGGDHDPRPVPVGRGVTVYHAADCSLCARALEVVSEIRAELGFDLDVVDIAGDVELEARYRALLPVVEIDGERAFTYFVDPDALRRRLGA